MRINLAAALAVSLIAQGSPALSEDAPKAMSHAHSSHSEPAEGSLPAFASGDCPPRDAATRAEMTALGVIERCADIELRPNMGGIRIATYLRVDASRARANTIDGITVETAPGRATFSIPDIAAFKGYVICNLDRSIRSEVPRSGRFKPKHGWVYLDARTARYQWDVKARIAEGATAPHLRVWAYVLAIPAENLQAGLERKWCRTADEFSPQRE